MVEAYSAANRTVCLAINRAMIKQQYRMHEEPDIAAARMAILALRASREPAKHLRGYRVMPRPEVISQEHAATTMALLTKPRLCEAVARSAVLEISCRPLEDPIDNSKHRRQLEMLQSGSGVVGGIVAKLQHEDDRLVLLIGNHEAMICTAADLRRWQEQYVLGGDYSLTLFEGGQTSGRADVSFEIRITPSFAKSFDESLPESWLREIGED
jgi:hypothetical protein